MKTQLELALEIINKMEEEYIDERITLLKSYVSEARDVYEVAEEENERIIKEQSWPVDINLSDVMAGK